MHQNEQILFFVILLSQLPIIAAVLPLFFKGDNNVEDPRNFVWSGLISLIPAAIVLVTPYSDLPWSKENNWDLVIKQIINNHPDYLLMIGLFILINILMFKIQMSEARE